MSKVFLNGNTLTLEEVWEVATAKDFIDPRHRVEVQVADEAWPRIHKSRELIEAVVRQGKPVYGVNTGFGRLSEVSIPKAETVQLQKNLIRSHACAVGRPLATDVVRAMMLLRANALAKGYSGIRKETLQLLVDCLNAGVHPVIPSQGSLGASGDLAPLAHLALVLMGEGKAEFRGAVLPGAEALAHAGLTPVTLQEKEGLALINGTQAMTAIGTLAWMKANHLVQLADGIGALTIEALAGIRDPFAQQVHALRPHPGQETAAKALREWLAGSQLTTAQGEKRVQDAYSLRCMPQVHGASRQVVDYVQNVLKIEVNAATDNPLVFAETQEVISGGHFHGQPVALAMDFLKIGMAEIANISERRVERLVNPSLSGLPAFLAQNPGLSSGLMILQYVAASLVSENKVLAHPASVDSIPSSAGQEDHVSMGTTAARQVDELVGNAARVLAIEAIVAAQAIALQHVESRLAKRTKQLYEWIRSYVPNVTVDRSLSEEIEALAQEILRLGGGTPSLVHA
ncbi:histidine ammonia-lyase [Sulfoacidibacillus thermotolerans]|uniref:Histidine ammonia-lyase n=1 Tax=Sulfoacidibacillus thermotolerans TaxID=1765684 RepID=A0A2U3D6M1_SULT2|nr:histidine ammonia-lyase [Sulfoacidibacillus thermotolerans]PWI56922.1 histidine ammonia-lyase [Sulfoacidibacillus thermotolerans]